MNSIVHRRNRAAVALFVTSLILVVCFLTWLSFETVITTGVTGERGAGRVALLMFQNSSAHVILKGIVAVLGVGSAFIARAEQRDLLAYFVIAIAALGIGECITILVSFEDTRIAQSLYDNPGGSGITSYEKLQSHTQIAMGGVGLWLLSLIGTQLGIHQRSSGSKGK